MLAGAAAGSFLLVQTMTDDVHRGMFALLAPALAIASIAVVAGTR